MKILKYLKKADLWLTIIIVIGILLVVNFFSYHLSSRWDLTQNKDFSLSAASISTAKKLDDLVNIKVYFSQNLPSQYASLKQEVGDMLDEYVNYSGNKIKVQFIDPSTLSDSDNEMRALGIPALQFNVLEKDKYQIVKGYLGMIIQYGDKKEVIPVVDSTNDLEYQITMAIKKATSQHMPVVGYLTSNGTLDHSSDISAAYKKIQEVYEVQDVDLKDNSDIPSNINTLIIAGPKTAFSDSQLKAIDAFLMRGGSIMFLVDQVQIGNGLTASINDSKLNNLLEKYGVKVNNDLVLDVSSGMAAFSSGYVTFTTNYPFWPKVTKDYFDQNNPSVAKLQALVLPWTSSLDVSTGKIDKSDQISYLAKSTNRAWSETGNFNLSPQQNFAPDNTGQKNLAISIFGKFKSAYTDQSTNSGRIVVVGDSRFLQNNTVQQYSDNLIFFQNLVDSLSLDNDLISIRSKGVSERPVKDLSDTQKAVMKFVNILLVTIVVILFGLIRYFLRRRSRKTDNKLE